MLTLLLYFLTGLFAGSVGSLVGLGGGIIIVPVLSVFLGVEPIFAVITISLMSTVAVSTSATMQYRHYGMVQWSVCRILVPASVVGIFFGYAVATSLPEDIVKLAFAFYLFLAIALLFRGGSRENGKKTGSMTRGPSKLSLVVIGWVMGAISPMIGVGGGVISTPGQKALGIPMRNVVANTMATMIISSMLGALLYFTLGQAIFPPEEALYVALFVLPGSIIGAQLGSRVSRSVPVLYIKAIFSLIVAYMAYSMLANVFGWG